MGEMSSEAEEGRYGHAQACANSGLESLAAEASRRAESMDRDLDSRTERTERTENNDTDTKSPSRSSGPRGKVRKAYTITKQRERWTEEEHDRFLQALKRYGRAWRKIEEHIGTKTAVQIRSHAQKFFSKLQREQSMNGGRDESSKNDISIPPPRPKRKPMHPYPRNSIDSGSGDHGEPARAAHQDPKPHPRRESLATTSTQVPASTPQYSNSSNYQPAQPVLNHVPLFHGQPSPFAGMSLAQQPSHVQLPPFPSLDTSGGENMSKVLKDAAVAAASAWNQVIAGASQKVQHQIQAQSYPPPSASALPMWGMPQYQEATRQNPFIPQLLAHVAAQQSASQQFLHAASSQSANPALASSIRQPHATAFTHSTGQRYKHMHDADKAGVADSDRESRGSEEGATARNFALDAPAQGGLGRWSNKQHHSLAEAKLGRTAWEMMNQVTAQKSREVNLEEARAGPNTKAPIKGDIGGSRRIMKPVPHSPRISPRSDAIPSLLSGGRSDTSQLAQFYQQAAASTAERDRQAYGNGSSGNGENGSSGDKGSSDGAGSDEANGQLIKDNGTNDQDEGASPRMKDLGKSPFGGGKGEKNSTNDLASNFAVPTNGSLPGSDKASNTGSGSGSDEDGITNASDMAGTRGDEKGSNEGSNSERASPRETSYLKDGSQSATKAGLDLQTTRREQHPKAAATHSFEAAWAAASLQSQQQAVQMALKQGRPSQAELMQQILPFTLTPQQQQAITTWAAANSQSQPHQFHMMQSLLAGFTSPNSDYSTMGGNRMMDRQISSLTSADTGSHTECNTAIPGCAFGFGGRASAPAESLCKRSSGFQPYSKRPADSSLAAPAAKRFSPSKDHLKKGSLSTPEFKFTPFGTLAVQSEQVQ